jgi:UDP-glucose 4-epimerase
MNRYILVTGGLGYIGAHVSFVLLQAGFHVVILDNVSNSTVATLETLRRLTNTLTSDRLAFVQIDIRDSIRLQTFCTQHTPGFSAIIHLAGLKSVAESIQFPELYYTVNVEGSKNVIQAAVQCPVVVPIFIFSSSATVYDTCPPAGGYTEGLARSPEHIPHMYGKSKRIVELYMENDDASILTDTQCISLRYFNPIGNHSSGTLGENIRLMRATNLLAMISKVHCSPDPGNRLSIFGDDYDETVDGTCERDFIHVMDLANGHLAALQHAFGTPCTATTRYQAYNLGTGVPTSVRCMVDTFQAVAQHKLPLHTAGRRPGDLPISFANSDKARQGFNWTATKTLRDACVDVIQRCNFLKSH